MEQFLSWSKPRNFSEVESFGILAGEENGNKIYVGRNIDNDGNYVASRVVPALKKSFYAYEESEVSSEDVEFLANAEDYHWVKSEDANLEDAAAVSDGYIGRALYNGQVVVGRVDENSRELVGSSGGKSFSLPSYDVLIYKSKGVVYEAIQKASNITNTSSTKQSRTEFKQVTQKSVTNGSNRIYEEHRYERTDQNYLNLTNKIRQLEMEKISYLKDKESYEQRLDFEQRKVNEMSQLLKKLKIENSRFSSERIHFEEKFTAEELKFNALEGRIESYILNNSFLAKKVNGLEEAIQYEKMIYEAMYEKFMSSQAYGKTLITRITSFEDTNRTQQQRIFELESEIMISSSSSESLLKRVAEYEATVKYLRLQMETYIRKLEISKTDNDFLVEKLSLLTRTLRTYQAQIECLTNKLQSSKTVIASAHADLSRANGQISKYQLALSSCYTLNGELMTKVSGMAAVAQNQVGSDCSMNLINYASDFGFQQSSKSMGYGRTSFLLEMTSSDFNIDFTDATEGKDNKKYEEFTPYGAATNEFVPIPTPAANGFTPYNPIA